MGLEKPLRELSATEIIDRSFSLYFTRILELFAPFFFASLLNSVVAQAVRFVVPEILPPERLTERLFEWLMNSLGVLVGAASAVIIALWIISTIANAVAVKYASDLLERGDASLRSAFNFAIYKLAPLLVAGLVSGALMILGLILFIVPGIIVAVMFSLTVPVIIIEDRGAFESLERSRRLVDKSWWKTFTVLLLVLFLSVILLIIGEVFGTFLGPFRGYASALVAALVQPVHALALTYLYHSMRVREERLAPRVSYKPPLAPTFVEQPRFCSFCGQKLPADAVFCPNCGNKMQRHSHET